MPSCRRGSIEAKAGHTLSFRVVGQELAGVGELHAAGRICFIAGLGNFSTVFDAQERALRGRHVLLFLENRGVSGSSSPSSAFWSIEDMAADVFEILAAVGWTERVHLVGHSMGAYIAHCIACRAPKGLVASLTQISACVTGPRRICDQGSVRMPVTLRGLLLLFALLCASDASERLDAVLRLNYPDEYLAASAFDGGQGTNREALTRFLMRITAGQGRIRQMTMIKQAGAVIAYRPLQLPAMGSRLLVILGEQDVQISVSDAHRHAAHAQARLLMLANAGHNCFVQCAAEVNTVIETHIVASAGHLDDRQRCSEAGEWEPLI